MVTKPTMQRRVHVLYEYGTDLCPHGSAFIRLLRPLAHPSIEPHLAVSYDREYEGQAVDIVIVDRLWRPDMSAAMARRLVRDVHKAGARLIYALDDNLLDLPPKRFPHLEGLVSVVGFLIRQSDGILVTTRTLRERFLSLNPNVAILPNALDERLLIQREVPRESTPFGSRKLVIGYMGTFTHDDDLLMILPALKAVCRRHEGDVELQIIGAVRQKETLEALSGLPVRTISPRRGETAYPLFMLWFTTRIFWDIAISPLEATRFNQCKSDIKFLDYSAIGAAGVFSRVPAYASSVRHMESGLLIENDGKAWEEGIETLLSDCDLRMRMARNASRALYQERTLEQCAHHWLSALDRLLEGA
jgi:glycosyltransferase involved in cell wall biosynthesis